MGVKSTSETSDSNRSKSELRTELIKAAGRRLKGSGVENFSTTKVADDCNTSTQMIYTLFGGKSGLIKAVYESKSDELVTRFECVDEDDPVRRFLKLGETYWDFMVEHMALFDTVMSLTAAQNYEGSGSLVGRTEVFGYLEDVLRDCSKAGVLPEDTDFEALTEVLWAGANGIIRLHTIGYFSDEDTAWNRYQKLATNVLKGKNDETELPI